MGPQYRPQYAVVLTVGTPKIVPCIFGKPPYSASTRTRLMVQAKGLRLRDTGHGLKSACTGAGLIKTTTCPVQVGRLRGHVCACLYRYITRRPFLHLGP